jgi:hypothetical protein
MWGLGKSQLVFHTNAVQRRFVQRVCRGILNIWLVILSRFLVKMPEADQISACFVVTVYLLVCVSFLIKTLPSQEFIPG